MVQGTSINLPVSRPRRPVVGHFCAFHALSAPDAVEFVPQSDADRRAFEELRAKGIVHEGIPRHYWIDLIALKADEDARRRKLVPTVVIACIVIAAAVLVFYQG
jgi:hypothetical protein